MYDIAVIGAGVAGLSAAVTARARNKEVLVIGNKISTGSTYMAENVDNYLGMPNISGKEMMEAFYAHAEKSGAVIKHEKVKQILSMGKHFSINAGDEFLDAKSIIIATGIKRGGTIKGEKALVGKGVSYCATCDGMLYRNKEVVVIGENEEAIEDVKFLSEICNKVTVISKIEIQLDDNEKIEKIVGRANELRGSENIESVVTGKREIYCDGVFIISESIPSDSLIYGIEIENGLIVTDKLMKTNLAGVFAAGDCTGRPFQISKAAGEGLTAAISAVEYLGSKG